MPIELDCPHCGARLWIPDEHGGVTGRCYACGRDVKVPAPVLEAPPEEPAAPAPEPEPVPEPEPEPEPELPVFATAAPPIPESVLPSPVELPEIPPVAADDTLDFTADGDGWETAGEASGSHIRRIAARLMFVFGGVYLVQAAASTQGFGGASLFRLQLEELGLTPSEMGMVGFITGAGWYLKPIFGVFSDSIPIFGHRRLGYLTLFSAVAVVAWIVLGITGSPTYWPLVIICSSAAIGYAFADVAVDGLMVETGQRAGLTGRFQATAWATAYLGTAISAFFGGRAAETMPLSTVCYISAAVTLFCVLVPRWLVPEPRARADREHLRAGFQGLARGLRSLPLWVAAIYLFLWYFSFIGQTAMINQWTGPLGFDFEVIGNMGALSSILMMVGALVYWGVCRRLRLRILLVMGALGGSVGGLLVLGFAGADSLTMMAGWCGITGGNTPVAGAMLISGISGLIAGFGLMPTFDLAARACPRWAEGTVFAALMAVTNLSQRASDLVGARLYENPDISWQTLTLISAGFTLICVPLAFVLPRRLVGDPDVGGAETEPQPAVEEG